MVLGGKLTPACSSFQGPKGDRGSPGEKVGDTELGIGNGRWWPCCWWLVSSRVSEAKMVWGCLAPLVHPVPPDRSSLSQVKM